MGPWSFGANRPPSPCRCLPTKNCPLSSTQILMILTQHSQNSALWSLGPSPTKRKVQKDVLTSPLLGPTGAETPIPELQLKERFSPIFWEPLPSPPLLQNSFLSLGLFSLLPHKGLTLGCFEWTRRQHCIPPGMWLPRARGGRREFHCVQPCGPSGRKSSGFSCWGFSLLSPVSSASSSLGSAHPATPTLVTCPSQSCSVTAPPAQLLCSGKMGYPCPGQLHPGQV